MSAKKINRALVQDILSKGDGVKTVASEAVDWVISVAEEAAKNLAASGRKTPGGRLMAPKMDPGLQARCMAREAGTPTAEAAPAPDGEEWTDRHEWQQQVRLGKTKLPYEEWLEAKKRMEHEETQAKERHGK